MNSTKEIVCKYESKPIRQTIQIIRELTHDPKDTRENVTYASTTKTSNGNTITIRVETKAV